MSNETSLNLEKLVFGSEKPSALNNTNSQNDTVNLLQNAWEDSDDERMLINLKKNPKLRKLMYNKDEEIITATELQSRLRKLHSKNKFNENLSLYKTYSDLQNSEAFEPLWVQKARKRKQSLFFSDKKQNLKLNNDNSPSSDDENDQGQATVNQSTGQNTFLSTTDSLSINRIQKNITSFNSGKIKIKKLSNIRKLDKHDGIIKCLEFHKDSSLLFSTSTDKRLQIYRLDGMTCHQVESIKFNNFAIKEAKFGFNHNYITLISNRKAIIDYNVTTGQTLVVPGIAGRSTDDSYHNLTFGPDTGTGALLKSSSLFALSPYRKGNILLCDSASKRLVRTLTMNAETTGICFHPTKDHLFTSDKDAFVYEWDIPSGKCIHRHKDNSALQISCLAISEGRSPHYLATGSNSGFLNMHQFSELADINDQPVKIFSNLTTPISSIEFHPSNKILAYSSPAKSDALKLIHIPTMTVFSNWPIKNKSSLRQVTSMSFSRQSGYFAIGNNKGNIQLYHIPNLS